MNEGVYPLGGCTFFLCTIKCIASNHPWRRIIMIYTVTKNGDDGGMVWGIKESTTPKGVGFCGKRRQTG